MFKIQLFCCFITQLVKMLQLWSLYDVIEDILPFVLNTKRPLSDIWLLRYKQNSFGCFREKSQFQFFPKTPKIVLLIAQQPNIAQTPFCIQNEREDILYDLKYRSLLWLLFELRYKSNNEAVFWKIVKTPNFGREISTHCRVRLFTFW